MSITTITRITKNTKLEVVTATNILTDSLNNEDDETDSRWVVSDDFKRIIDTEDDGSYYPLMLFRDGEEVIAVPEFYLGEYDINLIGSKRGEYTFNNETLVKGW